MPEVTISIGGREFDVACQEGEQPFLESAARMLDGEAQVLVDQIGRMPEPRLLLMSGLMLADKTAGLEDMVADLRQRLASHEATIAEMRAAAGQAAPSEPTPSGPSEAELEALTALVEKAEALGAA